MPAPATRLALGCLAVIAGCGAVFPVSASARQELAQAGARTSVTVVLRDIGFHRATVEVRRGGSVTWKWRDGVTSGVDAISHDVTSVGRRRFRSASARDHGSTTRQFNAAGVYRYECTIHAGMTGRVVVR